MVSHGSLWVWVWGCQAGVPTLWVPVAVGGHPLGVIGWVPIEMRVGGSGNPWLWGSTQGWQWGFRAPVGVGVCG